MKKIVSIIWVFLCLSCNGTFAQANLTMMTYNIKGGSMDDIKAADIAKIINSINPDVVSVQEVNLRPFVFKHDYLKDIADATGMYYKFLPTVGETYGIGLLSRKQPLSVQTKIIPFTDSTKDKEDRGMIIAEFPDYFFIATHYSLNADDRDTATKYILDFTNESPKTVFAAGDFNAKSTYRAMVTFKNYGYKILNNTSVYTFPSDIPTECIDMIISYSDFPEAVKYNLIESGIVSCPDVNLVNTSDHLPLFVRLSPINTALKENVSDRVSVLPEEGGIKVEGLEKTSMVSIYRSDGYLVKRQIIENNEFVSFPVNSPKGLYLVTLKNELYNHSFKLMFNT